MSNKYERLHEVYLGYCQEALRDVVAEFFQKGSRVSEAAEYALMNGGKRVRGVLALAVCDMLCGDAKKAASFAATIEMVHAFSLVHDDLPCMDDDDLRRGKPAAHIAFGEDTALLAGDMLAIQAFQVIAETGGIAPQFKLEAASLLAGAAGAKGMIYGQELDLRYEQEPADEAALLAVHQNKTGALLRAAAGLGVLAAEKEPTSAVELYAGNIGLVFQIIDDILDVTASQEQLGKPIGSDKAQGKTTFATLFGIEEARLKARELTEEAQAAVREQYGEAAWFLVDFAAALLERAF